jgi:hypothetical protein
MQETEMQRFGEEIWLCDGPVVTAALGFHFPTRMAVIRLADGGLFVWSPVALSDALRTEIAALGPVRHLVAPNHLHHVFLSEWQAAYPEALTHAAPGLAAKRPDLRIDHELGAVPHPDWTGQIAQAVFAGNRITTEVVFHHVASGTVVFCDLLQHYAEGWFKGWRGIVARLDAMQGTEPAVPRKFRVAFRDKAAARAAARVVLSWPATAVVMAHGVPVTRDASAFLRRAFRWLRP